MFRIGQKVVCVDDESHFRYTPFRAPRHGLEGLTKGQVYTVRDILISLGVAVIRVEEITRDYCSAIDAENVYAAARFRPLIERKTDISFAHEILRKVTRKDRVRA